MFASASANVTLMVSNLPESFRFYTETLGLDVKSRHGDHWAEVTAPGITIGLHPGGSTGRPVADEGMSIGFLVEDFDATVARLEERGLGPRVTNTDRARSAYFTDPDGYTLYAMWRA
jgi:catechol 2,3-dioxygenase-like lactoylglutathione lyase family enzyme